MLYPLKITSAKAFLSKPVSQVALLVQKSDSTFRSQISLQFKAYSLVSYANKQHFFKQKFNEDRS
ncbi:hypothetical protein MJC1_03158 [Methylocystis sp. MJC1]|nr:hypothetical protein MJC1_03158 [Methylocystis sp. MJC1]